MITQADLKQFTGTEQYYFYPLIPKYRYTDGVKYLAEKAGAYWLLDAIFSYHRAEPFQVWELAVTHHSTRDADTFDAVLTMREDSDKPVLVEQKIEYTDFPLARIELWLIGGVLILPSEY